MQAQPSVPFNTFIKLQSATSSSTFIRHSSLSFYMYATYFNDLDSIFKVVPGLQPQPVGFNGTLVSFQSVNYPLRYGIIRTSIFEPQPSRWQFCIEPFSRYIS